MVTKLARLNHTIHPSAVLRGSDEESRRELFDGLVADLQRAASLVPAS